MEQPLFWCHVCRKEIHPNQEMLCPQCNGGFVEPLESEDNAPPQEFEILQSQPPVNIQTRPIPPQFAPGFQQFQELSQIFGALPQHTHYNQPRVISRTVNLGPGNINSVIGLIVSHL
eukprot:TRINITY_DN7547_c0_g1_i2.p1 TRINITY_DN7547_c0_g1~~TRINITY_DN7547_c0_g1_i2.p1  ORF type:complete len:132 (-),score=16.78 TRINITY_DN7547_c0_g1_i2:546-896(-)